MTDENAKYDSFFTVNKESIQSLVAPAIIVRCKNVSTFFSVYINTV